MNNRLTPQQDAAAVAAAYLGSLAACIALICALVDAGSQSRKLAEQCVAMGNSRSFCELTYYGR